ncbi:MAG: serine/threonine-protein kinase [Myxococcales bacterium]
MAIPTDQGQRPSSCRAVAADGTTVVVRGELTTTAWVEHGRHGVVLGGTLLLECLIGSGNMGQVYQARHLPSDQRVAVKLMHPRLQDDEAHLRRFRQEAASASMLRHPNAVVVLSSDPGSAECEPYIVMELLQGRNLSQVLRNEGTLPIWRIVGIMSQVLSALSAVHAHGLVHRDIKPANIMLVGGNKPDFVKVCDFGIAQFAPTDHEDTTILGTDGAQSPANCTLFGTPAYMSPEQARGEPVDGRTDLYAVAVTLYQLVTGHFPFPAPSRPSVLFQQTTGKRPRQSCARAMGELPADLQALIMKGLAEDPRERPPSADAFRQELQEVGEVSLSGLSSLAAQQPR